MTTTTEVETITLGDIPRETIRQIVWFGFSGCQYWVDKPASIAGFIYWMRSAPVIACDGGYRSVKSEFPYESFEVELKPCD